MARLPLLSGDTPALMCHQVRTSNTNTKYECENPFTKKLIIYIYIYIVDAVNKRFLFANALDMKR